MVVISSQGGGSLVLPNPEFGNRRGLVAKSKVRRAMDGTPYSTVKNTGRRYVSLKFVVTRLKADEAMTFYQACSAEECTLRDYDDSVFKGHFGEEFQISSIGKGEYCELTFDFEGRQ